MTDRFNLLEIDDGDHVLLYVILVTNFASASEMQTLLTVVQ